MGKWVLGWQIGSLWSLLFLFFLFPLNQCFCLRERHLQGWVQWAHVLSARVSVLRLNRWHPEDEHASVSPWRQAEWQTHWVVSCCLAFCSSSHPLSSHHTETPTCCRSAREPALCSVTLRVKFSVCCRSKQTPYIYWLPGNSNVPWRKQSSSVRSWLVDLIQHSLTLN